MDKILEVNKINLVNEPINGFKYPNLGVIP